MLLFPFVLEYVAFLLPMFNLHFCLLSSPSSFCVHSLTLKVALTTSPSLFVLIFRISVHLRRVSICCFFSNYTFTQPPFATWYLFSSFVQRCCLVDRIGIFLPSSRASGQYVPPSPTMTCDRGDEPFPLLSWHQYNLLQRLDYFPCLYA